jgi:hypothetical protein
MINCENLKGKKIPFTDGDPQTRTEDYGKEESDHRTRDSEKRV